MTTTTTPDWSAKLLRLGRSAGPIPVYGSPQWHALDWHDPRRIAAAIRAAECWRLDGTDEAITARLQHELAEDDRLAAHRLRQLSRDLSAANDWTAESRRPSWAELERRRFPWKEAA